MSTEIRDIANHLDVHRLTSLDNGVHMTVHHARSSASGVACALMGRADFLAAVEAECGVRIVPADAIVIPLADLPEVTEDGEVDGTSGKVARFQCDGTSGFADSPPWRHRQIGISHLALAEYQDAHPPVPPVDAAQVEALACLLWEYAQNPSGPGDTFDETTDAERNRHRNRARRLVARGVRVDLP